MGRKVILGIGNILNSDEGLGVHALRVLGGRLGPGAQVDLVDGGVLGLDLLPLVEDCSHLLVLDAVNAGQPAGTIVELGRDEIPLYSGVKLSQHQVTFQEVLALANLRGNLPPYLHLIGVQPADLAMSTELSPVIAGTLVDVAERSVRQLRKWGLLSAL